MVTVTDAVLVATYDLTDILAAYHDITYNKVDGYLYLLGAQRFRSRMAKYTPNYDSYCGISGTDEQMDGIAYPGSDIYIYSHEEGGDDGMYKFEFDCTNKTLVKTMNVGTHSEFLAFTPDGKLTGSTTNETSGICSRIYELNLTTGGQSVLYEFETAFGGCRGSGGHDFFSDGKILYIDSGNDQVQLFETDETWLYTWNFSAITTAPSGCAWDGNYLWLVSNGDMKLYKLSLPMVVGIGTSGLPIFAKMLF